MSIFLDSETGLFRIERPAVLGVVYVVGFDSYIKIGWSRDVAQRLKVLRSSLPVDLTVHSKYGGTMRDEAALHQRFASYRLRGEWFRHEGDVAKWIEKGCST